MDDGVIGAVAEQRGRKYVFVRNVSDTIVPDASASGASIPPEVRDKWSGTDLRGLRLLHQLQRCAHSVGACYRDRLNPVRFATGAWRIHALRAPASECAATHRPATRSRSGLQRASVRDVHVLLAGRPDTAALRTVSGLRLHRKHPGRSRPGADRAVLQLGGGGDPSASLPEPRSDGRLPQGARS